MHPFETMLILIFTSEEVLEQVGRELYESSLL